MDFTNTQVAAFVGVVVVILIMACLSSEECRSKFSKKNPQEAAAEEEPKESENPLVGPAGVPSASAGCYQENLCQPSSEAYFDKNRRRNPYQWPKHDPGHDVYGYGLNNEYCRYGLGQEGIVDGENDLWRFQIYTVQPSMVNLKFQKVHM